MASCIIGVVYGDGSCKSIHCQYDGEIELTGNILFNHYNTVEKAQALVALGDIKFLGNSIEKTDDYFTTYDEEWCGCLPSCFDSLQEMLEWHSNSLMYILLNTNHWVFQVPYALIPSLAKLKSERKIVIC